MLGYVFLPAFYCLPQTVLAVKQIQTNCAIESPVGCKNGDFYADLIAVT